MSDDKIDVVATGVQGHLATMALHHGEKWKLIHDDFAELIDAAVAYRAARSDFITDTHGVEARFDAILRRVRSS